MRINYKHFVIGGLALNFMLEMSPSQAAKQRMVCPSDGKRPMFNVICPGGEEPIPIEEYNESRPPPGTGSKSRRNCSRMPNGKVSAECDSPVIVTKTSRQAFEPEMMDIPAGSFEMGSPSNEQDRDGDEGPVHTVHVKAFQMGKYEITRGQFRAFVNASGYKTEAETGDGCYGWTGSSWEKKKEFNWRNVGFEQNDKHPVVCVSWNDSQKYIEWLNNETGKNYRLPSEAEWEYAARAGTTTARYWGNNSDEACRYANVADETAKQKWSNWIIHNCDDGYVFTSPVGKFQPNDFGLYDMLGNVWEWNQDKWHNSYTGAPTDGSAWEAGDYNLRLLRGCSWGNVPVLCRSAVRYGYGYSYDGYGVRVVAAVSSP